MSIANCPMCQSTIPAGQLETACVQCGADLSRSMHKSTARQPLDFQVEPFQSEGSRSARNGLYCLAGVWTLPFLLMIAVEVSIKFADPLDIIRLVMGGVPFILCIMAVIAAVKCGAGKKIARLWAFLPVWVLMFCFPIGTIVAYMVHTRLGEADLN